LFRAKRERLEAGLVYDQDGLGVGEGFQDVPPEVVAYAVCVPVGGADQALHAVGGQLTGVLGELPGVLALEWAQESAEVSEGAPAGLGSGEAGSDAAVEGLEVARPRLDRVKGGGVHPSSLE
jgi:hypothetical protein